MSVKTKFRRVRHTTTPGLIGKRALELLALAMVGEGAIVFVEPRRHIRLWHAGPRAWRRALEPFEKHPRVTRWIGAAEAAAGFYLALKLFDDEDR